MNLNKKILNSEKNSNEWKEILKKLPPNKIDIYYSCEYVNLCLLDKLDSKGYMFVVSSKDNIWINVFLKVKIPKYINLNKNYYDLETPYGYGGPTSNSNDKKFLVEANNIFLKWIKSNNIVAELTRFHPLINNYISPFFSNDLLNKRKTCSLDLNLVNPNFDPFKSKAKNMLRNSKNKLTSFISQNERDFIYFKKIYLDLMKLKNANKDNYFSENYFKELFKLIKTSGYLLIISDKKNNKIAGGIFLYSNDKVHYHISASDKNFNYVGTMNLLIYDAALYAQKLKIKTMHLGGGNTSDEKDSLFRFKKSMSNNIHEFQLVGRIHNREIYQKSKENWCKKYPEMYKKYKNFFLNYHFKN